MTTLGFWLSLSQKRRESISSSHCEALTCCYRSHTISLKLSSTSPLPLSLPSPSLPPHFSLFLSIAPASTQYVPYSSNETAVICPFCGAKIFNCKICRNVKVYKTVLHKTQYNIHRVWSKILFSTSTKLFIWPGVKLAQGVRAVIW